MINQRIPNLLRRYRRARGLNQQQAAEIIGVSSANMISRWEKGWSVPSGINVFKLAALYRTMADVLFPNLTTILRQKILRREKRLLKADSAKAA